MRNRISFICRMALRLGWLLSLSLVLLGQVSVGHASTTITVNTVEDVKQGNDGFCSLREAIIAANTDKKDGGKPGECEAGSGDDTIVLQPGIYRLSRSDNGKEDSSSTGDLDITTNLTVTSDGSGLVVIDAADITDRVFHILGGQVTISGVTIRNGGSNIIDEGGGIFNAGHLTLVNSTISNNTADLSGGGIYNTGWLTLNNVTITNNTAAGDGGVTNAGGTVEFQNTIIAGNTPADCSGTLTSLGYNLVQNPAGCTISGDTTGNITADPLLIPIPESGETKLYGLAPDSPALDAGNNATCESLDQLGHPRPLDGNDDGQLRCDLGALEDGGETNVVVINAVPSIDAGTGHITGLTIDGLLSSAPNTTFDINFMAAETCDPSGFGPGPGATTELDSIQVTTDEHGDVYFDTQLSTTIPPDQTWLTASATVLGGATSAFSQCVAIGPDNASWPRALELPLLVNGVPNATSAAYDQYLDKLGQSRWYRFKVTPNSRVIITLTNLPENKNYDLTVYKNIEAAYRAALEALATPGDSTQDLLNLNANIAPSAFSPSAFSPSAFSPSAFSPSAFSPSAFSPSAFSPSAFSPSAFSPSAFSPSAFSPSAFSPSAFSPSAFSPDAFSPSAFSPSAFSPSAFSPSAFSPSAFSPSAFSPSAFSSAQTSSLIGVSAFEGNSSEGLVLYTWNEDTYFYVRVRGRDGAFSLDQKAHLEVTLMSKICEGVNSNLPPTSHTATANDYKTIILTDLARMEGSASDKAALQARLNTLADRPEVSGVIVDVGGDDRVEAANIEADKYRACPYAKNLVADAVKAIIDDYWELNDLQYVVIVGDDDDIPFFRVPDQAMLGNESDFVPPVRDDSHSQASLRLNYVLTQDRYGARREVSVLNHTVPVPELAVGRLVETAADATGVIDAYLGTANGVVSPQSAFVSGYDFMEDVALEIEQELSGRAGLTIDALIAAQGLSPQDPAAWTAQDLGDKILKNRYDVAYLAGHFSANSALAADYSTSLLTTDLLNSNVDMTNAIFYSNGCHSGYNIVNEHDTIITYEPDWAQAFAQKKATLIAGTAYQYGDTDFIEYSERLYLEFTRQLRAAGQMSIGEAFVKAKQLYLAQTPELRGIHEKALLEATIFGLPMLTVEMPNNSALTGNGGSIVPPLNTFGANPGATLGLQYANITVNPALTLKTAQLKNVDDPGGATVTAKYLTGSNGIVTNPSEPTLPLEVKNVSVSGTVLRGVGFRGGDYVDLLDVLPLTGAPTTEIRGVHTPFFSTIFYPVRPWSQNYFGALAGGDTNLMLMPAQFISNPFNPQTGTMRQFTRMDFRLYYSNNSQTYTGNSGVNSTPALSDAPTIVRVEDDVVGDNVNFRVNVVGNPAAGVQEVWLLYTATSGPWAGQWQPLDLVQNGGNSTLWTGGLPLNGTDPCDVRYIVQAVNGVGMVSLDANLGAYYTPCNQEPTEPTALSLDLPATGGAYRTQATFNATLTSNGAPLADMPVFFILGAQSRLATTKSNGEATVSMSLLGVPGDHDIRVIFPGNTQYRTASAWDTFTISKAGTQLSLDPPVAIGKPQDDKLVTALLTTAAGQPISERTVFFVVEDSAGNLFDSKPAITDYAGRAFLGDIALPYGTYTLKTYFNGTITLKRTNEASETLVLDDNFYDSAFIEATDALILQNTAPTAHDNDYQVDEDTTLVVTPDEVYNNSSGLEALTVITGTGVLTNDVDPDTSDTLTAVLVTGPASGTLTLEPSGAFTYTPAANFYGLETFTYQAYDGTDLSNAATVTLIVNFVNDPPLAEVDAYTVDEDMPLTITAPGVLDNDTDVEGHALTALVESGPAHGDVTLASGGAFVYTPTLNFNGLDFFTYKANDPFDSSNVATVTITIDPVNDPLIANDTSLTVDEDTAGIISVSGIVSDADGDLDLAATTVVTGPANGSTTVDTGTGEITYTPNPNYNGPDSFTYGVSDGEFNATATVNVTVNPVNDPPLAGDDPGETGNDAYTVNEENVLTVAAPGVLANDSAGPADEEQTLTIDAFTTPANGTLTFSGDGSFTYEPNPDFFGSDTFTYTVCDSDGECTTATVTITISNVNDPPVANDDPAITDEDVAVIIDVLANDEDADNDTLTVSAVTQGEHGQVTTDGGTVTYTPAPNHNGSDSFTYTATDGNGGSDTATVNVTVNPVNDPPQAADDPGETGNDLYTVNEENILTVAAPGVLANDSAGPADEDQILTIDTFTTPANGALNLLGDGSFTYEPNPDFFGSDSFTYTVCDSGSECTTATVTITVNNVNDPPVAYDDPATTDEDVAVIIDVLANDEDVDNDTLTVSAFTQGEHGQVTTDGGTVTYTPAPNYNGSDSFTYTANDGNGGSDTATVNVIINPVNDSACDLAAATPTFIWPPDKSFHPVSVNTTDPDGDPVTVTILGIRQDEKLKGKEDAHILGPNTAEVRAERDGNGDGRVYHIEFTADDGIEPCHSTVRIGIVDHDQSENIDAIDGGPLYDSTGAN